MAANLTIGSLSLASDGITLTGTISGGTGTGYAPASGVTGCTVRITDTSGITFAQTSATIATATLTIVTTAPIPSGATVKFDILAGSNLTDSGGNTATGQSTVAVTNNSTVSLSSFAYDNAGVAYLGPVSNNSIASRTATEITTTVAVTTSVTGSAAYLRVERNSSGSFTVAVDGGAPQSVTIPATGSWYLLPLFTGLSDAAHTVYILGASQVYIDKLTTIYVRGASPAVAIPSGYAQQFLTITSGTTLATGLRFDGGSFAVGTGTSMWFKWPNQRLRWTGTATDNKVWMWDGSGQYIFYVDGVQVGGVVTLGATSTWKLVTIGTGLAAGTHVYTVQNVWATASGPNYFTSILPVGGVVDSASTPSAISSISAYYGDSITSGSVLTNSGKVWCRLVGDASGRDVGNRGFASTKVAGSGDTRFADVTGITSPAPTNIFILYGTNDYGLGTPTTLANFKTAYKSMLASLRTGCPSARLVVCLILPRSSSGPNLNGDTLAQFNTTIQTAVSEVADGNTIVLDTSTWVNTTTDMSDGLHLNDGGNIVFANRIIPVDAVTSYSITGASSGSVGSPVTLTFTRAGGSTWVTGETVSMSDGAGGSFGAFTFTNGQPTATMTYTPSTVGAKTLTPTNGQTGWTNPSNYNFTSNSSGGKLPSIPSIPSIPST